jgi:hypothetical protein
MFHLCETLDFSSRWAVNIGSCLLVQFGSQDKFVYLLIEITKYVTIGLISQYTCLSFSLLLSTYLCLAFANWRCSFCKCYMAWFLPYPIWLGKKIKWGVQGEKHQEISSSLNLTWFSFSTIQIKFLLCSYVYIRPLHVDTYIRSLQ